MQFAFCLMMQKQVDQVRPHRMSIEDLRSRPWVLLPGTLCTGAVFEGFLNALGVSQKRCQIVSLHHPVLDAYAAILSPLSKGAVVCGFSLGAIVAAHHSDSLGAERVILFGLNPLADDPQKAQGRHDLALDVAQRGGAAALMERLPPLYGPDPVRTRARILAMAQDTALQIDAQTNLALTRPSAMEALSRTQAPVMVLTGVEDRQAPLARAQAAARIAPHGQFRAIPRLGHYALLEDPEACARAVLEMEGSRQ